jgi:type IV pilus assembly protein PilE
MQTHQVERRSSAGFTLVEVMVVVVIIAVLAAIALPSYQDSVRKATRRAAQAFMLDVANREQQYFLDTRSFATGDQATFSTALKIAIPKDTEGKYSYKVDSIAGPPLCFTITATAEGSQEVDGPLTLTCTGEKKWNGNIGW